MLRKPTISIVIPVYKSQESLPLLVEALAGQLPLMADEYELILVNDGSPDASWQVIQDATQEYGWVSGIHLMRNYGQHSALLCGIRAARYEIVITMDDDLQHPVGELPKLLAALDEQCDVVYGTPQKQQHGLLRDLASEFTKIALQSAMGASTARKASALRAFRTELRNAFATYDSPYVSIDVLLTWATTRFRAVEVLQDERRFGHSNYTLRKLIIHAINMITGFSVWPLQMTSWIGFGLTFFGVIVFLYVILRYLVEGGSVPGFPFLASVIAIFSGAQLFALGMIGEYLARMHFRLMKRPAYTVRMHILPSKEEAHGDRSLSA
ncbi:MAG TPA: glycosyltransferase family 2 protein [Aggregatilineales bacterium]|nr:glycosyltransferase [Anaerolineales bacterium]HRE48722.1 glycosyltransferase family 2 protein [Aggregatilineales bacterium]